MVKRIATADEIKGAMSDPDDIHTASNGAVFFVVFRLMWYIIVTVSSAVAVGMLAYENNAMASEMTDFSASPLVGGNPARSQFDLGGLCAFNYMAEARKTPYYPNGVGCLSLSNAYVDSGKISDEFKPSSTDTLRCNMVTGILSVGTFYGFVLSVITGLLLCNRKVQPSKAAVVEFVMAFIMMILYIAMGSIVTLSFKKSCNSCMDLLFTNDHDGMTCTEFAIIDAYVIRTTKIGGGTGVDPVVVDKTDGYGMVHFDTWNTMISGLQDGLWAGAIAFLVLSIITYIRFQNARGGSANLSTFSNPNAVNDVYDDETLDEPNTQQQVKTQGNPFA